MNKLYTISIIDLSHTKFVMIFFHSLTMSKQIETH
jgi:hypothetical protein